MITTQGRLCHFTRALHLQVTREGLLRPRSLGRGTKAGTSRDAQSLIRDRTSHCREGAVGTQDTEFRIPVVPAGDAENVTLNSLGRENHLNLVSQSFFDRIANPPNADSKATHPAIPRTETATVCVANAAPTRGLTGPELPRASADVCMVLVSLPPHRDSQPPDSSSVCKQKTPDFN